MDRQERQRFNFKKDIKIENNKYIVQPDGTVSFLNTKYCLKCGNKLDDNGISGFCDRDCKRELLWEIRKDGFEIFEELSGGMFEFE